MKDRWTDRDAVFAVQTRIFRMHGDPDFRRRDFSCYSELPLPWRMPIMTNVLEAEVTNGGLAQFLWNVFFHYRAILDCAKTGYELIGATDRAAVVARCGDICGRYEAQCRPLVEAALRDQATEPFQRWYAGAEEQMSVDGEELLDPESGIVEIKGRWILKHLDLFRGLI